MGMRLFPRTWNLGPPTLDHRERDTPSLQIKRDLRNLWTTILLTAGGVSVVRDMTQNSENMLVPNGITINISCQYGFETTFASPF